MKMKLTSSKSCRYLRTARFKLHPDKLRSGRASRRIPFTLSMDRTLRRGAPVHTDLLLEFYGAQAIVIYI